MGPANGAIENHDDEMNWAEQASSKSTQDAAMAITPNHIARDPFVVLPCELFTTCVQLALPLPERGYTQALLQLTMVSRQWRDTIVSTPSLWASITVSRSDQDSLAMIITSLHLSRQSMITLTFCHTMSQDWALFCSVFVPHANRIQHIVLVDAGLPMKQAERSYDQQGRLYYFALERVIELLGTLPVVVSLDVGTETPVPFPEFAKDYGFIIPPTVRYMRRWTFQSPALEDFEPSLSKLRELHTEEPVDVLIPILPHFLQLERLACSDPVDGPLPSPSSTTTLVRGQMPELTSLVHTQKFSSTFQGILLMMASNLQELIVEIPYSETAFLVKALQTMERLQNLSILLSLFGLEDDIFLKGPYIPLEMRSLRTLSIAEVHGWLTEKMAPRVYLEASKGFISTVVALYPNVEDATVSMELITNLPLILAQLQKLTNLRKLSLRGDHPPETFSIYELSSVEVLSVESADTLECLVAPKLLRLSCDGGRVQHLEDFCRRSPMLQSLVFTDHLHLSHSQAGLGRIALDPNSVSAVRSLYIRMLGSHQTWRPIRSPPPFHLTSLPCLTRLVLSGSKVEEVFPQATLLCLTLLCQSDICPKLQELSFEGVPEWDILFLMLEARNLSAAPSVSPITSITLSTVPYHLRSPLASLLRGEPTTRPSNTDLSLLGIIQGFLDQSL